MAVGRVTVFGGTGFVGRALAARLAADGTRVRVAARRPEAARTGPNVEAVKADILDDAPVRAAVAGADAAINLVGILSESGRHTFEAVHVAGAGRVAAAARDAGGDADPRLGARRRSVGAGGGRPHQGARRR